MSCQMFMPMKQTDFYELKLFALESREEFLNEYRNYDKKYIKELYLKILIELEKTVLENNIKNFLILCNAILYITSEENSAVLKDYYDDVHNPIKNTNLVILTCKHNKVEFLKHLFGSYNEILYNLSAVIGKNAILPNNEDESSHNAFYYAIRSGNVELLSMLINWPGNYFSIHSQELDETLSSAFEELKLKNVSLLDEMEFFVENKLIDLRFFSNSSRQEQNVKNIYSNIKERIDLVVQNFILLKTEYSNTEKIDEKFLFIAKSIAQNIHILKRKLKFTYNRLPWEEVEFCLVSFISSYSKQQEMNLFYHSLLDKDKIFNHLENFTKEISEIKNIIENVSFNEISKLPKLKREKVVAEISNKYPQFVELYNDYQEIRDIFSLNRINIYIKLALSVSPKEREGRLIITRVLQVIGEYLKNSHESPNLSTSTAELLLQSLPKNIREIIIDLRNSLSHADSLSKRTEIEENMDVNFFTGIQNDTKKVGDVIAYILYKKKIKIIRILLNKLINCKNSDEMNDVIKIFKNANLETQINDNFEMSEFVKLEKCINKLGSCLTKMTPFETELISKINSIMDSAKTKIEDIKMCYVTGYAALQSLFYISPEIMDRDIDGIKLRANLILQNFLPQSKSLKLKEIAELSWKFFHSIKIRMQNDNIHEIRKLVWEIFFIIEFETNDIKWIQELRKNLNQKCVLTFEHQQKKSNFVQKIEENQLTSKLAELKKILSDNLLNTQSLKKYSFYKKDKKLQAVVEMLVLDIMSILSCCQHNLENNVLYLDDNIPLLIGKCLRNHLAHDNFLVDAFLSDPSISIVLNAQKLSEENIMRSKKKIGKLIIDDPIKVRDKFNRGLVNIINQKNMFTAVEEGNLENLKDCLRKGADINARSMKSWTLLHFAAKGFSLEIVKFLVDKNLNADIRSVDDQNPLHIAATYGRGDIVKYFIKDVGLSVDSVDKYGKTALHYAAQNGHVDTTTILLKCEANPVYKDEVNRTPIHFAATNNHVDVYKILVKYIDIENNEFLGGFTPLHAAAEYGHLELLNYLLENGADVNAKNDRNWTPLHAAAFYGNLEVVNALILKKANVNARVINGCTPLHYAVESSHIEITKILLKYGASVNAVDKSSCFTPLHYAAKDGHKDIVEILIKYGANTNVANVGDVTPLHMAVRGNYLEIVTILLKYGANIHAINKMNRTPLHYASLDGYQKLTELLIEKGAEINIKDETGLTPLHMAALKGHKGIVDVLLKNKADVNARDDKGNTVLHAAAMNDCKDVIDLLIKNKAEIDAKDNCGITPLQKAAFSGGKNAVIFLIKNKAAVNSTNVNNLTPLHAAVTGGHKNIVDLLLKNKAEVNVKSIEDATPLHLAVDAGFKEIVEILIANGADVNIKSNSISPLHLALKCNREEIAEVLIRNGTNASIQNEALLIAVTFGYTDLVKILLKNKAKVNTIHEGNLTALHVAAQIGQKKIVDILVEKGAKINAITVNKETPLYFATMENHKEVVKVLISYGASVTVVNDEGFTPLHAAAAKGHVNVVQILLDCKVDINIADYQNRTPLELAVSYGHLQIVKMLLNYQKVDLNAKGNSGWTVLHIAAQGNDLDIVKFLASKGSNISAKNDSDSQPIHIAAREGFLDAVKFFLAKGLSINIGGNDNQTLLHYAAMKNRLEVVKYLIAQGADVNAVDKKNNSPLHLAVAFRYKDIVEVLLKNGALYKKTFKSLLDQSPGMFDKSLGIISKTSDDKQNLKQFFMSIEKLHEAVKCNNPSVVENMIKAGAVVDVKYANGLTSLHYATWKGYYKIVNILLKYKANSNVVDNEGYSPLHYAAKFSHLKIAMVLLSNAAVYNAVSGNGRTPLNLATSKELINLLKLIDESFKNIKVGNSEIINQLNKIKDISTVKAILGAYNEEHKTLIVVGMLNNFPKVEYLKQMLQDNVSANIAKAETLLEYGDVQKALSMFKGLFENRKQLLGPDNPGTLDLQTYIAKAFFKIGNYQKALSIYEEIFTKQNDILGFNNKDTLNTKSSVALTLHSLGRSDESLKIFEEVFQKQKEILGPNDTDTLDTQFYMALVLDKLERYDEALSINREVLEKKKKKNVNDPAILQAENNIAMVLANQEKYEEAFKIYESVWKKKKEVLGVTHSSTLKTLSNIAGVLANLKKYPESIKAHQEILDIQIKVLGQNHPDTLITKHNLAHIFFLEAKWTSALRMFTELRDQAKTVFDSSHPIVSSAVEKLKMVDEIFKREGRETSEVLQHLQEDIYSAISDGDVRAVQQYLNSGININDKDIDGRTLLYHAVYNEKINIIKILLKHGADIAQVTNKGNTVLHTATSKGNKEIVEIMLQHVCHDKLNNFINAKTTLTGTTPLHIAVKNGSLDIVKILLKNGAIFNIQDKQHKIPLDFSSDQSISSLLKFIEELFTDASKGEEEIIGKLNTAEPDEYFAAINSRNKDEKTLLQVALINGHSNISALLIRMLKHKIMI